MGEGAQVVLGDVLDDLGRDVAADLGMTPCTSITTCRGKTSGSASSARPSDGSASSTCSSTMPEFSSSGRVTHETTQADDMRVIEVNQVGAFLGMRTAIPAMMRHRGARL